MTRPAKVEIDLAALRYNLSRIHSLAPHSRVLAVVKADAYGHGIERVARALDQADAFGVACLEEAEELRTSGITQPIVLLEGPYSGEELESIRALSLEMVIHDVSQIEMLEQSGLKDIAPVWLKVDSGMHRLGFDVHDLPAVRDRLINSGTTKNPMRLMTHLAVATEKDNPMTKKQLDTFSAAGQAMDIEKSIANSAAIINFPGSHADWVRPGLLLYGVSPIDKMSSDDLDLRPVMTLGSAVIAVKYLQKGEPVGYGASWFCPHDMKIGIVAAGYGDGFPRHANSGTPVLINGKRSTVIGNASMDMLAVDLSAIPEAEVGARVELWGKQLPIEEVAKHAGTIPYELLCGVQKRLQVIEHGD